MQKFCSQLLEENINRLIWQLKVSIVSKWFKLSTMSQTHQMSKPRSNQLCDEDHLNCYHHPLIMRSRSELNRLDVDDTSHSTHTFVWGYRPRRIRHVCCQVVLFLLFLSQRLVSFIKHTWFFVWFCAPNTEIMSKRVRSNGKNTREKKRKKQDEKEAIREKGEKIKELRERIGCFVFLFVASFSLRSFFLF